MRRLFKTWHDIETNNKLIVNLDSLLTINAVNGSYYQLF